MSKSNALARLLDMPMLERIVPQLAPETLHRLITHNGLDACGELVTAATPAQLTSLLDLDLWPHAQPGRDERFDVDRFGEWLEVLVDTGESIAARTVAAIDPQLVILGLSRYLRVLDPGVFEPTESSDDEAIDRNEMMRSETRGDSPECELGGYLLRARRFDAWDAIIALLGALEAEHADYFHAVMRGCRSLSNSTPEYGGLDDLLLAPEQHLHDVAVEREQRRSQQGFATAADARAFLQMARQPRDARAAMNPIVAAYFRAAAEEHFQEAAPIPSSGEEDTSESLDAAIELLTEAGMMPDRPRALLSAAAADPQAARLAPLRERLRFVQQQDESAFLARGAELAFLANTLLAGCSIQSRQLTPQEASDAAACMCNLGLEGWPGGAPEEFLVEHDLVSAFEMGWSVLHRDVTTFAVDQLIATLDDLPCDADARLALLALKRRLSQHRDDPWRVRGAIETLASFDTTASVSVAGLLDECPILAAALTAVVEGRTTPVSPTAFDFISTIEQIDEIRKFMGMLPSLLG